MMNTIKYCQDLYPDRPFVSLGNSMLLPRLGIFRAFGTSFLFCNHFDSKPKALFCIAEN